MRDGVLYPPIPPKIALVGEAWGEEELKLKQPFVGTSGQELRAMCGEAGIGFTECLVTNVFCQRPGPSSNELKLLCTPDKPNIKPFSIPLVKKPLLYLKPEFYYHIESLWDELKNVNVVVALGNTAIWALLGVDPTVSSMRGTFWRSPYIRAKIIPTYHPAAVIRQWPLRTIVLMDLIKAKAFSDTTEISRPSRSVYINPTLSDLDTWKKDLEACSVISIDLEVGWHSKKSSERFITCISFAPSPQVSYVVPFVKDSWKSYWETPEDELKAWEFVEHICRLQCPKVFQKHLFDTYILRRLNSILVGGYIHDTLHLHHAMYPEIQKDLGFLGSIYTEEEAWKLERPKGRKGQEKRDD